MVVAKFVLAVCMSTIVILTMLSVVETKQCEIKVTTFIAYFPPHRCGSENVGTWTCYGIIVDFVKNKSNWSFLCCPLGVEPSDEQSITKFVNKIV